MGIPERPPGLDGPIVLAIAGWRQALQHASFHETGLTQRLVVLMAELKRLLPLVQRDVASSDALTRLGGVRAMAALGSLARDVATVHLKDDPADGTSAAELALRAEARAACLSDVSGALRLVERCFERHVGWAAFACAAIGPPLEGMRSKLEAAWSTGHEYGARIAIALWRVSGRYEPLVASLELLDQQGNRMRTLNALSEMRMFGWPAEARGIVRRLATQGADEDVRSVAEQLLSEDAPDGPRDDPAAEPRA
jgi:hypothetical protein